MMKKIASFSVNHDLVTRGMFISRIDGDVVTYDIRMKTPNGGDYLSNAGIHTFEHLFATYARNSEDGDQIIYVGPMGCRTGFYFLVRDTLSHEKALILMQKTLDLAMGTRIHKALPARVMFSAGAKPYFAIKLNKGDHALDILREALIACEE